MLQASGLALWLSEKSLWSPNSSAIRSFDFAMSLAWKIVVSVNRAGTDASLGSPKLNRVWEKLIKKENIKFQISFRAHANLSFFSFTANPPLLQEQQSGFWRSASHLEYVFEAIPGTCRPQEPHTSQFLGCVWSTAWKVSQPLMKVKGSLLKAWPLFQDRGCRLVCCGPGLVCRWFVVVVFCLLVQCFLKMWIKLAKL